MHALNDLEASFRLEKGQRAFSGNGTEVSGDIERCGAFLEVGDQLLQFVVASLANGFLGVVLRWLVLVAWRDEFPFSLEAGGIADCVENRAVGEFAERLVKACEFFGRGLSDLANAHGVDPAGERLLASLVEGFNDFRGVLFTEPTGIDVVAQIEVGELFLLEFEEIERGGAELTFDEGLGNGFADPVDIEGFSGGELLDFGDGLGGAGKIAAAPGNKAFFLSNWPSARGALMIDVFREGEGSGVG